MVWPLGYRTMFSCVGSGGGWHGLPVFAVQARSHSDCAGLWSLGNTIARRYESCKYLDLEQGSCSREADNQLFKISMGS